jgi:hypothetical protein
LTGVDSADLEELNVNSGARTAQTYDRKSDVIQVVPESIGGQSSGCPKESSTEMKQVCRSYDVRQ